MRFFIFYFKVILLQKVKTYKFLLFVTYFLRFDIFCAVTNCSFISDFLGNFNEKKSLKGLLYLDYGKFFVKEKTLVYVVVKSLIYIDKDIKSILQYQINTLLILNQ